MKNGTLEWWNTGILNEPIPVPRPSSIPLSQHSMLKHIHRGLWLTAGLFFALLGIIGLMLPVVPQIPFFLAAIICFMRCSKRFNNWMEKQAWFVRLRARFHRKPRD